MGRRKGRTIETVVEAYLKNGDVWKWENGYVHRRSKANTKAGLPDAWIPRHRGMSLCQFLDGIGQQNIKGRLEDIMMW